MRKRFTLDKQNGKLMGVCAGIARMTGWDVTAIRVATVVFALVIHPLVLVYFIAAWLAPCERSARLDDGAPAAKAPRMSTYDMKRTMGEYDRRLAEIDSCMASANSPLAREIESLR
jgi:phage shock protein C